jgi:hypothetical protein
VEVDGEARDAADVLLVAQSEESGDAARESSTRLGNRPGRSRPPGRRARGRRRARDTRRRGRPRRGRLGGGARPRTATRARRGARASRRRREGRRATTSRRRAATRARARREEGAAGSRARGACGSGWSSTARDPRGGVRAGGSGARAPRSGAERRRGCWSRDVRVEGCWVSGIEEHPRVGTDSRRSDWPSAVRLDWGRREPPSRGFGFRVVGLFKSPSPLPRPSLLHAQKRNDGEDSLLQEAR